jgi:hypothetical protein
MFGADPGHARLVHLRRPQRRDVGPQLRLGDARLGFGGRGAGHGDDRAFGHVPGALPFLHFFDGFRTSHEVNKIELLTDDDIRSMLDDELIAAHRERALDPDRPVIRGTAQNPDVFFQAREACNPVLQRRAGHRPGDDGPFRETDRTAVPLCSTTSVPRTPT